MNVTRVIRRLGGLAPAVICAGGATGYRLAALLAHEKAPFRMIPIADETREDLTVTDASSGEQYRFVMPGPRLSAKDWQAAAESAEDEAAGGVLVISGSLPPGASSQACARLCRRLRRAGVRVALDSGGPALRAGLSAGVWLIKPNLAELEELEGQSLRGETARLQACRRIIETGGARMVALSLGAEGALLVTAEQGWRALPPAIKPLSSVGAGDSFLAGLVWALVRNQAEADALRWAVAAASATLLAPGTQLGSRTDARRLAATVRVEPLLKSWPLLRAG